MQFSQQGRRAQLSTTLGEDDLVLSSLEGDEELSGDFEWRVQALSQNGSVDLHALLGTRATVKLAMTESTRYFDGIVAEAHHAGATEKGFRYDLVLRPWLHIAGLRRNQRIFHDMTAVQIVTKVLSSYSALGAPHFTDNLDQSYPTLEYTVQYGESDADFCRRLLERFGITWSWQHTNGNHEMILTDSSESHPDIPGGSRPFYGNASRHLSEQECFREWAGGSRITTGSVRLTEYNFKTPYAKQDVERVGDASHPHGQIESFDWPGDYLEHGEGRGVVARRVGEERGQALRHTAVGDIAELGAGQCVTITGDKMDEVTGRRFLCLRASHSVRGEAYSTAGASGQEEESERAYSGEYVLLPPDAPFRPSRRTMLPRIQGPQTAVVVGDGEIDCDEYGRILVRYHWDLNNAISMRCRVSQNWASRGWGGMVIPRIGMEVIVEHLEGDPDKPIVTGCVYNGANMPPYPLPAAKTKSVFKTDTHQGSGFNELTFEDEKGEELIYMHGQKDQDIQILNDRGKTIGRDQRENVGRDKKIEVGRDHSETVNQDAKHTIGRDVIYKVGQNQQEKYGKDHVHVVGNIHKQDIFADHLVQTGRNHEETVLGRYTLNVNQSITNNTKTHTLMAFDKFVIKGPGGKITIDSSGITLQAAQIMLKGNVSMGGGGGAQVPTLQGAANAGLPLVEECIKQNGEEES